MTWSYPYSQLCTKHKILSMLVQTYCVDGFMYSKCLCLKLASLYLHNSLFSRVVSMTGGLCLKVNSDFISEFDFLLANKYGFKTSALDAQ